MLPMPNLPSSQEIIRILQKNGFVLFLKKAAIKNLKKPIESLLSPIPKRRYQKEHLLQYYGSRDLIKMISGKPLNIEPVFKDKFHAKPPRRKERHNHFRINRFEE